MRNTEPHQKCSSRNPPTSGPIAEPAPNAVDQTAIARVRSTASVKMLRISDSVDGISVRPGHAEQQPGADQRRCAGGGRGDNRRRPERAGADEQDPAAADRSARLPMSTSRPARGPILFPFARVISISASRMSFATRKLRSEFGDGSIESRLALGRSGQMSNRAQPHVLSAIMRRKV
ncbi:hypothetical protein GCM10020218_065330 [Dactylosporangium vinaceum]